MTSATIRVIARVTAQRDRIEDLRAVLRSLLQPTRAETGCLDYQLFQDQADNAEFVFVEEWASDAAIDNHMTMPHVQAAFAAATPLLAKTPEIRRFRSIT